MFALVLAWLCCLHSALKNPDASGQDFTSPDSCASTPAAGDSEAASLLQVSAERSHYHYAFYVLLENNHHRSSDAYVQMLDRLCRFSSKSQLKNGPEGEVRIVGDHEAIHERVPSCANMTYGTPMTLADLGYSDVVDKLPKEGSSTCTLKFLGPELQHNVVKIWMNKVGLLCKLASEHPNAVTTLLDANSNGNQLSWATETAWRELQDGRFGTRQYKPHTKRRFSWYNHKNCTGDVRIFAKYLAIRGRDCPRLLQAWEAEVAKLRQLGPGDCPCFDEEWILSKILNQRPELFQLQGDPT